MAQVMREMARTDQNAICPGCDVGLNLTLYPPSLAEWLHPGCKRQSERAPLSTPQAGDMFSLTLSDFSCSDFDSQAGSSNYPKRDCPAENEAWAKFPSVETAPCCSNYTLAIGSLLLMAEYANGGPPNSTLETLIEHFNDKDKKHELFRTWASMQISPGSVPGGSNAANHFRERDTHTYRHTHTQLLAPAPSRLTPCASRRASHARPAPRAPTPLTSRLTPPSPPSQAFLLPAARRLLLPPHDRRLPVLRRLLPLRRQRLLPVRPGEGRERSHSNGWESF